MSTDTLQHALQDLPNNSAGPTSAQIKKLAALIDGDQPLQPFLEQLVPQLCEMFSAMAGVAWLRAHATGGAIFGVPYQMDRVIHSTLDQKKHEKLVQLAWQQRQPMLAEPQTGTGRKATATSSPTSHALLFGPVMHFGDPIALIELVLQDQSHPLAAEQKKMFLRSIQLIGERVHGGLRQRMTLPAASIGQAVEQVRELSEEIGVLQQQIRRAIEQRIQQFHGWAFGSLEENQRFAKMLHQLLDNHGLRVACAECGHPSILRCLRAGNAKHGVFVYDHYLDTGRTFHGGPTTVPLLRVVNKPIRRTAGE
ncbi:MAG: hypothetical protein IT423_07500 [Pirellulaceae bacterium]|nr:hypothetical protein [Pirellulaceae bacterium]